MANDTAVNALAAVEKTSIIAVMEPTSAEIPEAWSPGQSRELLTDAKHKNLEVQIAADFLR